MALPPRRHGEQSRGQGVVRVSRLELTLEQFNLELGQKVGISIARYHMEFHPPFHKKVWRGIIRPILLLYGLPAGKSIHQIMDEAEAGLESQRAAREPESEPESKLIVAP